MKDLRERLTNEDNEDGEAEKRVFSALSASPPISIIECIFVGIELLMILRLADGFVFYLPGV